MKLFEVLDFYKNVVGADISQFQIEHGDQIDTFYLDMCGDYFRYLKLTVATVGLNNNMKFVFRVLKPGIEE